MYTFLIELGSFPSAGIRCPCVSAASECPWSALLLRLMTRLRRSDPDRIGVVTQLRKLICDKDERKILCCPINQSTGTDQIIAREDEEGTITDQVHFLFSYAPQKT